MTAVLWALVRPAVTGFTGYAVWLFTHDILHAPTPLAGTAAVGSGLAAGLAAHMLMAIAKPAAEQDPWEHGRELLHREHVPEILHRTVADDDETRVLSAQDFAGYRGERRSLKSGERP